jgi:hypothetical protein
MCSCKFAAATCGLALYVCVCVCVCMYVCVRACVRACVCVCVRERERASERERQRERERESERVYRFEGSFGKQILGAFGGTRILCAQVWPGSEGA